VRNLVAWADVTTGAALHMCTRVPADLIGEHRRGRLVAGARADLALWNDRLEVTHTIMGGQVRWEAHPA
jgi:N-acetylglucosamine-6-phosphate deacetylase